MPERLAQNYAEEDAMKNRAALATLLLVAIATLAQASPQQKVDPAKAVDIHHLLEVTGAIKLADQSMSLMVEMIKPQLQKDLPKTENSQKILETFIQRFQARFLSEMNDQITLIYDKHLSAEDIKGLIQFYESPLGQRTVKALPQISRESQLAGSQLGQKIGLEVFQQLQQEYPELKQEQKPGPGNP